MAAPSHLNGQSQSLPRKVAPSRPAERMSGDLILMAALIGISRAVFGARKKGAVVRTLHGLQETIEKPGARGRQADTPAQIPTKGWKDIALRVYEGIQNDRILLVAAGVTFYGLLALFPAIAALVSLYGLFTDATTINEHLRLHLDSSRKGRLRSLATR